MSNEKGVAYLPIPGSKGAPSKFKGSYSKVEQFLEQYEKICNQKSVTSDHDKVRSITQYCSKDVRRLMEALPGYITPNWERFKSKLLDLYDAERDTKRYRVTDLEKLVVKSKQKPTMRNMAQWKGYVRNFTRTAGCSVLKSGPVRSFCLKRKDRGPGPGLITGLFKKTGPGPEEDQDCSPFWVLRPVWTSPC